MRLPRRLRPAFPNSAAAGAAWVLTTCLAPSGLTGAERWDGGNPDSPDTIELTRKMHAMILAKAAAEGGPAADRMAKYSAVLTKGDPPGRFEMLPIPAGTFTMGSPESEPKRKPDEGPRREVKIDAFWMAATELTWDLYQPYVQTPEPRHRDGSRRIPLPDPAPVDAISTPTAPYTDMSFEMGHSGYPAISMTLHAASKYCQWVSAQTGHFYRLPTEAEWEYAARAGSVSAWCFGDDESKLVEYAWYWENSDGTLQPVGRKKPNAWGLHDMHGNVCEWVMDQYNASFYATLTSDEKGGLPANPFNKPVSLYPRVVRGGSWDDDAESLRSACRRGSSDQWMRMDPQLPKSRWYTAAAPFVGFRMVRPLKIPSVEEMHDAWNKGHFPKK